MGHRSWLVQVKNLSEVKTIIAFTSKADEICEYDTFAHIEAFFQFDGKLWVGFSSDGTTCGKVFHESFLPQERRFELLGEGIGPEDISYLTLNKFITLLKPKTKKEERAKIKSSLETAINKRTKELVRKINPEVIFVVKKT